MPASMTSMQLVIRYQVRSYMGMVRTGLRLPEFRKGGFVHGLLEVLHAG